LCDPLVMKDLLVFVMSLFVVMCAFANSSPLTLHRVIVSKLIIYLLAHPLNVPLP
jgi:hypothetical protein